MINRLLFLTALTAFSMVSATASTPLVVNQTYNSGSGGGAGSEDPYFNLYSYDPTPTLTVPVVASPIPGAWYQPQDNGLTAQWISPTEDQAYPAPPIEGDPAGTYDYNAVLATDFLVPTEVTFTGSFAADNDVTLNIDGTTVTSVGAPAYGSLTSFTFSLTIFAGERFTPIDFVVNNLDDTGGTVNPTGLLVSNLRVTTSQTPEPSTYLLVFASIGSLLMVKRVRRAVSL
jgi:hypothetical protein